MILKEFPKDFVVNEILNPKFKKSISKNKNDYKVFKLKKEGENTLDCLKIISKVNSIPFKDIGYSGLKDRKAITTQFITIPSDYSVKRNKFRTFELSFEGYSKEKLNLGDNLGNNFRIRLKDIDEMTDFSKSVLKNKQLIFPNYFDDQRFTNTGKNGEFLFSYIMDDDFEGFAFSFLTNEMDFENSDLSKRKKILKKNYDFYLKNGDFSFNSIFGSEKYQQFYNYISRKENSKKDFSILKEFIGKEDLRMWYSSFESFLFNEGLFYYILKNFNSFLKNEYLMGEFIFPEKKISDELIALKSRMIFAAKTPFEKEFYSSASFNIENFEFDFSKLGLSKNFSERNLFSKAKINFFKFENRSGFNDLIIDFDLSSGSYATVFLKYLFGYKKH